MANMLSAVGLKSPVPPIALDPSVIPSVVLWCNGLVEVPSHKG